MRAYAVAEIHMAIDAGEPLPEPVLALAIARSLPGLTPAGVRAMDQDDVLDQIEWLNVQAAAAARDRVMAS